LEQLVEREERDVLNVIKGPGAELPHKYHPKLTELAAATERVAAKERDGSTDSQSESSKNAAASPFDHLFDDLVVTLSKEMSPGWSKFMLTDQYTQYCNLKWFEATRIGIKSFMVFRDLGRGAFGVVSGARCSATGTLVAIKCMNRRLVKGKKALKLVEAERDILAKLGERPSQFTVWLKYSFTDKTMFYLCLPLCTGGDLGFHLRQDRYFSLARARFYAAEILLGLQHLHGLGVLYRDLKPENILLDNDGHARISDMGLAIYTGGKSMKGRAGTPGYWAPEMIQKQRYGDAVDWWSFGCVLYEFLTGRCPFSKQNTKMERDEATIKWTLTFPKYVGNDDRDVPWPVEATDIITKLLNRDPSKRLGARRHHVNIREHSFFGEWSAIDWFVD
jgi:serine/threonine protein kinase